MNFVIKKDIIEMIQCEETQTGHNIRKDVKAALQSRAGWQPTWKVNWCTDNEPKQTNASDPSKHADVGLKVNHRGTCVDHTIELASEETLTQCPRMATAVKKVRSLINYMKDSYLARVAFNQIMLRAEVRPLALIQGTDNR